MSRARKGRRPRKLKISGRVALARRMFADQSQSISEMCAALGISRATLYRDVKKPHQQSDYKEINNLIPEFTGNQDVACT